jgi:molecular chaperone GrpE (heat shock protein)
MIKSLYRLAHWFTDGECRSPTPRSSNGDTPQPPCREGNPLTGIRLAVQDAGAVVENQYQALRLTEDRLARIEEHLHRAWQERDGLLRDYHAILKGLLRLLDDVLASSPDQEGLPNIRAGLEKLLKEQGVERIPIAVGEPFQPETQCCEQTEPSDTVPPGSVVRILESGYRITRPGRNGEILRSARVVVSQSAKDAPAVNLKSHRT